MEDALTKITRLTELLNASELKKELVAQIKDAWQQEMRAQQLQNIQLKQSLDALHAYFEEHGHLFVVHPNNPTEIMKDFSGLPIPVRLPNSEKELNARKQSYQIIQGMNKLVDSLVESDNDSDRNDPNRLDPKKYEALFAPADPKKAKE